jgi:predicted Zn-dependent protease
VVAALGYSRRAEEEADVEGFHMLQQAGIDPAGMIAFFERVLGADRDAESPETWQYLSTHPTTRSRIDRLRSLQASAPPFRPRRLGIRDWADVKRICAGA